MQKLKSGYTTGTHATATLVASLYEYFDAKIVDTLEILLPKEHQASIEVTRVNECHFSTIKGDNDDIDVTKGAIISCKLLEEKPANLQTQTPSFVEIKGVSLFVWAGSGVGVVTKKGLKITPTHPAINPTPLSMMQENSVSIVGDSQVRLHAVFFVEDGEKIARDTANAKVGVVGGISILGTRGIVKPVSASAYIDSIQTEIDVAAVSCSDYIVFTLGNTAVDYAKELYDETSIIEIGNFVYDASERLKKYDFKRVIFITSVAKMTKVAQGFKNTHNKFGTIDFAEVRLWIEEEIDASLEDEEFVTLKGVLQTLSQEHQDAFVSLVSQKSAKRLREWFSELGVKSKEIEVITLPKKISYLCYN